ncbi:hypothetical protein FG386_001527 [Cryptosporidium ryanae]|uniref:uncharacterized protein n=1 Tax=Cryptosporidium ryanae TaxID=515981 RepID=UPI00351A6363|nr:hypothetical protein FG386_001527 [Cryptosporidium ryanae]
MVFDTANLNRNDEKLESNNLKNSQLDDELLFWINIEDEYFNEVNNKIKDILKFHINSSEYILNTINEILSDEKSILDDCKSEYSSSCLVLEGGLAEWNKINNNLNGDGYGLYDSNDTLYLSNDNNNSCSYNNETQTGDVKKCSGNKKSKIIKNIRLTISIPPLYKPNDFPKELNQCNSVREILLTLFRIQCMNKYTALNTNRNLYNINDKLEDSLYNKGNYEFDKNKTCNYVCILPDIITGPNVTYFYSDGTESGSLYNFNDMSENWIFNINNSKVNLYLRKRLLDTSDLQFNDIRGDHAVDELVVNRDNKGNSGKNCALSSNKFQDFDISDLCEDKNVSLNDCSSNVVRSIIGSGEYIKNDIESFMIDEDRLISIVDDKNSKINVNNFGDSEKTTKIKKLKSFGDFFQDNINISPNIDNILNDYKNGLRESENTNNNLNSIINFNNKTSHILSGSEYFSVDKYNIDKRIDETRNIYYLNRINNISLENVSKSLIKRLEEIYISKVKLFKVILERIENERQIDVNYWLKKEYELSNYYRIKKYELNNYNYTLEKQCRDLEIYRLGCIESKYLPNEWQETAMCSICGNDTDWDEDPIYFCDGCYQPAHHSCVNPKQPFKYNSTRMLNVIEREKKCQQGDFDSENLNLKNKNEQEDDDQWWLCDSCLSIKSELLDHNYLFSLLIRMISGPRNSESYKNSCSYIQKNADLFLSQLVNYNVISSNVITNTNDNNSNDVVVFPWITEWKFPLITERNLFCESEDIESSVNSNSLIVTSERRKGRPRKTPIVTLNKPKDSYCYFTFEFDSRCDNKDNRVDGEGTLYLFNDWIPSIEMPYNLADLDLFNSQIFNPIRWYTELNKRRKMNQTPPICVMTDNNNLEYSTIIDDDNELTNSDNMNKCDNSLFDVYKSDNNIIEKLLEKKVIEFDSKNNKYRVHIKVPICQLCGYDSYCRGGGIMKKTVDGYWSHIRCALSNNSVLSNDGNYVRIKVDLYRNKIKCEGCNKIDCSPVLCHNNECFKYYHINCASSTEECIVDWENSKPIFYCPEHSSYIAPTLLLRKYQLSHFNRWFYDRYCDNNSIKNKNNYIKHDNNSYKNNDGDKSSMFINIFNLPIIIRQTFLSDLRDDTQTILFLTKLAKKLYNNSQNFENKNNKVAITNEIDTKLKRDMMENESMFNSFSKFHLYLPELVYVQSVDTVISRLSTPWSGNVNFWLKSINNSILSSLGISNVYSINQYRYIDNSRLIITCIFNTMELLLNRLMNPYEIRLITLIIASKMGFGPWFSLFYYWKFIPLTFYYNIIKNYDLSMLEPVSDNISNPVQSNNGDVDNNNVFSTIDDKNINYHLNLFGLKYLSIEKLNPNEACLKSLNSCYSIISRNWNYCCQICNSLYPIFDENMQISNSNNNYLYKCKVCNLVICFNCNSLYNNVISIRDSNYNLKCERCFYFESKNYINVITDSCCCLCSRFDNVLIRIHKGTYIDFQNVKSRKTLLSDGCIYLDEQHKLINDVWIHPVCIEWLTTYSKNQSCLINNIVSIEKKYFNNFCKYCGLNNGVTIKCSHNLCNTHFHISCGKSIGCKFDYSKYKNKQYEQYCSTGAHNLNYNNSIFSHYQQQYRRSWCLYHNQYSNNSNSQHFFNDNDINIRNHYNNNNSGSCDLVYLRALYNNIIESNFGNLIDGENLSNSGCTIKNQTNDNTLLKISLFNYYGLNIFEDYNKGNKNLNNINIYNIMLFSNNLQIKNDNINYQCGQDIMYISKWDDLIQIFCYDVISRFVYGIGFPKQKYINSSINRNLNQHKKKSYSGNTNISQNIQNFSNVYGNSDISNNICIACDKLYKRDWSLLYLDWIYCDTCNNWFHWCCLGLNKERIPKDNEPYKCMFCSGFKKTRGRKRKTLINPFEMNVANVSSFDNSQYRESYSNSKNNEKCATLFPYSVPQSQTKINENDLSSLTSVEVNNEIINSNDNSDNINHDKKKYNEYNSHIQPQLICDIDNNGDKQQLDILNNNGICEVTQQKNGVQLNNSVKFSTSSQSQHSSSSSSLLSSSYSSSYSSPSKTSITSESSYYSDSSISIEESETRKFKNESNNIKKRK